MTGENKHDNERFCSLLLLLFQSLCLKKVRSSLFYKKHHRDSVLFGWGRREGPMGREAGQKGQPQTKLNNRSYLLKTQREYLEMEKLLSTLKPSTRLSPNPQHHLIQAVFIISIPHSFSPPFHPFPIKKRTRRNETKTKHKRQKIKNVTNMGYVQKVDCIFLRPITHSRTHTHIHACAHEYTFKIYFFVRPNRQNNKKISLGQKKKTK